MKKLDKPIVFFDIETTGLSITKDRICSLAVIKINLDWDRYEKYTLVNPTIDIPSESTKIHGITNEMVKNEPVFADIADSLYNLIKDCDIGGYNNDDFDNELLAEEFARVGISFPPPNARSIDVCTIFKKKQKRDLAAAYQFYCGKELERAHNAAQDISATVEIFIEQLRTYPDFKTVDIDYISNFCKKGEIDNKEKKKKKDNEYYWNFGKAKGTKIKDNIGFGKWVLNNDFETSFKNKVRKIFEELKCH